MRTKRAKGFAIALALGVWVCAWATAGLPEAKALTFFSKDQAIWVDSTGWFIVYCADWKGDESGWTQWLEGNTYFVWNLPWEGWKSFYLYDYSSGKWTEVYHMLDQGL